MPSETQELKDAGLKITLPRVKILQIMESSEKHHLSAEDLYKQLLHNGEEIGLATVYRVLTQFESVNLVQRHLFEEGHSVFEIKRAGHHDHIVCVKCGAIEEFEDEEIETRQRNIATQHGYVLTGHQLNLYGICPICQAKDQ